MSKQAESSLSEEVDQALESSSTEDLAVRLSRGQTIDDNSTPQVSQLEWFERLFLYRIECPIRAAREKDTEDASSVALQISRINDRQLDEEEQAKTGRAEWQRRARN